MSFHCFERDNCSHGMVVLMCPHPKAHRSHCNLCHHHRSFTDIPKHAKEVAHGRTQRTLQINLTQVSNSFTYNHVDCQFKLFLDNLY